MCFETYGKTPFVEIKQAEENYHNAISNKEYMAKNNTAKRLISEYLKAIEKSENQETL